MANAAVVTDSTASLPDELRDRHGIRSVSLYVNFEGGARTVRESDLMARLDDTYDDVRASEQWPTTSQPSVGDFVACYEPLLAEGRDVVSVHISGGISGTCDAARQAADALAREGKGGERVRVVDSRTAAGGLGLLALTAGIYAEAGASSDEIERGVREARRALHLWFAVDTLEFLRRGGRIGSARAWLGSTLRIKPILTIESEIQPIERVRTAGRAFERLLEYGRELKDSGVEAWVVQHIRDHERAARLVEAGREIFGSDPFFTSEIGPVLGVHTGPGLLGIGGLPPAVLEP